MAFPHPQSRKDHHRKEDKPSCGGVVRKSFKRTIDITDYRNAKDDVIPTKNRTFGGVIHDRCDPPRFTTLEPPSAGQGIPPGLAGQESAAPEPAGRGKGPSGGAAPVVEIRPRAPGAQPHLTRALGCRSRSWAARRWIEELYLCVKHDDCRLVTGSQHSARNVKKGVGSDLGADLVLLARLDGRPACPLPL